MSGRGSIKRWAAEQHRRHQAVILFGVSQIESLADLFREFVGVAALHHLIEKEPRILIDLLVRETALIPAQMATLRAIPVRKLIFR